MSLKGSQDVSGFAVAQHIVAHRSSVAQRQSASLPRLRVVPRVALPPRRGSQVSGCLAVADILRPE